MDSSKLTPSTRRYLYGYLVEAQEALNRLADAIARVEVYSVRDLEHAFVDQATDPQIGPPSV